MPKSHPSYPPELRRTLVEMVRAGRSPSELAEEFEPSEQCIRNWVKQTDRDAGKRPDGLTTAEPLKQRARRALGTARRRSRESGETAHVFGETRYRTKHTWPYPGRVVYKAEVVRLAGREPKDNELFRSPLAGCWSLLVERRTLRG